MIGYGMDFMDGQPRSSKKTAATPVTAEAIEEKKKAAVAAPVAQAPAPAAVVVREKTPISFGRDIALSELPSLAETIGYVFFPFSFLVGPQFSFSLYKKFISMELFNVPVPGSTESSSSTANGIPQGSLRYATRCFALGIFYLGLGQVLGSLFPTLAILDKTFLDRSFAERLFLVWWTGKTILNKVNGNNFPELSPPYLSLHYSIHVHTYVPLSQFPCLMCTC
jgi:lysophospholipid acyltransferase 5